jgi:glycosyltransferase involved in cell wall biosynthesis
MDNNKKVNVKFFQRKPIPDFHFSVENIFADVRENLPNLVNSDLHIVRYFSKGIINRLLIILEVFFAQGQINHFTGDILFAGILTKKKRNIQTILDLYFLHNSNGLKRQILKWLWLDLPIQRARYVTCISQATKDDILKLTNFEEKRIFVIPIALGSVFKYEARNYNYDRPTLLQIGSAPNKNVERIIEAVAGLNVKLIILGKHEEKYEKTLLHYNVDYNYITNLNSEEMKNLYKVVDVLIFPSLFEGFGMPIIEAQAMGTPVLTSNLSSMPEVAGDGALLVDPYSVNDIKDGVVKLIEDCAYRNQLIENGFRNCQRFNSKEIANQYYELYKQV